MIESGRWESGEGVEEGGRPRAQVAVERAQVVAGGVASRVVAAWTAMKERFRDAVEEGKEGIAEGQDGGAGPLRVHDEASPAAALERPN